MIKEKKEAGKFSGKNELIAGIFYEMADILEIKQEKWKPQAYRIAAQTLEGLKKDVEEIYKKQGIKGLERIPGIGEGLARKIIQFIETGIINEHEKLKKSIHSGLYEMMNIPGVGAKKASLFYNKLKIKTINQLEEAARKHKLFNLPGFKEKAEQNILEGISMLKKQKGRIALKQAEKIAGRILKELRKLPEVRQAIAAGSLRRKKSTIGDIDIVIKTNQPEIVAEKFVKMPFVKEVLGKGREKATIITKQSIQVDIRFFTEENFGSGLLYFTGDKQHNIWLRKKAIKKAWKLSEYGLFQGSKRIAGKTEKEIYKLLNVKFPKPENRIGETE